MENLHIWKFWLFEKKGEVIHCDHMYPPSVGISPMTRQWI